MKIRQDFVTNSSSSSFILAFKDEKSIEEFKSQCEMFNYENFYDLISRFSRSYISFDNYTKKELPLKDLAQKVLKYDWPDKVKFELYDIVNKETILGSYKTLDIIVSDLGEEPFDASSIGFEDIEDENDEFSVEFCKPYEYEPKDKLIEEIKSVISHEYRLELVDKAIKKQDDEDFSEYWKRRTIYSDSEECKKLVDEYLKTTDFKERVEKINNAKFLVHCSIDDFNGGLLEWAIRNGFVEQEFYNYCVYSYNVG